MPQQLRIKIVYCNQCHWLLRAAWMAQELLSTFADDLSEVALVPAAGGIFEIRIDNDLIWSRKDDVGFPTIKELKRRVRDRISPDKHLGHIDQ